MKHAGTVLKAVCDVDQYQRVFNCYAKQAYIILIKLSSCYGCSAETDFCSCNHIEMKRLQLKKIDCPCMDS